MLLATIFIFGLSSCVKDNSAYLAQEKEDVVVDEFGSTDDEDSNYGDGELIPGVQTVRLNVTLADGTVQERRFKYYMPVSTNQGLPISLVFEFHEESEYPVDSSAPDPIESITSSSTINQLAIKENLIIIFPAGSEALGDEDVNYVNWEATEEHLLFVDAIINYFKGMTPLYDINRVYATGQSSGADFCFELAYERPEIFAAIAPRAGQLSISNKAPYVNSRAVPIISFHGANDTTSDYATAVTNMTTWAKEVGGYFDNDMVYNVADTLDIPNYSDYLVRSWSGARADYQHISLLDQSHSVTFTYLSDIVWTFFNSHTFDSSTIELYLSVSEDDLSLNLNQPYDISVKYTEGATITYDAPASWNPVYENDVLSLTAPSDFFANGTAGIGGVITITAELNGITLTREVVYTLLETKSYFEVGDVYYDDSFTAAGVVVWVDPTNIKKAKIVELSGVGSYGSMMYCGSYADTGLGLDFTTPDKDDGYGNTQAMIQRHIDLGSPYTSANAVFLWADELNVGGLTDWYIPAINECVAIWDNIDIVNEVITSLGGTVIPTSSYYPLCSSTTEVIDDATVKTIYSYGISGEVLKTSDYAGSEYLGYVVVRALKEVSR